MVILEVSPADSNEDIPTITVPKLNHSKSANPLKPYDIASLSTGPSGLTSSRSLVSLSSAYEFCVLTAAARMASTSELRVEETEKEEEKKEDQTEEEDKLDLFKTFLRLEEIDTDLYRSTHLLRGRKAYNRVYGGQVVGQAMMAAQRTVPPGLHVHSLHCNFLYQADADRPLVFAVTRIRDSRSFATRLVRAKQQGKCVFSTSISYQVDEPDAICHQSPMPDVPPPEECEDAKDTLYRLTHNPSTVSPEGKKAASAYQQVLDFPQTFQIKFITPRAYLNVPLDRPMKFACWVRSNTKLGDDDSLHHCVAAFMSDVTPIGTPLGAHAAAGFKLGMAASLDHSMWIHRRDFRIDTDWLLYETESTIAAASRSLIHGKMWTRDGRMVISTSQEILIRGERE